MFTERGARGNGQVDRESQGEEPEGKGLLAEVAESLKIHLVFIIIRAMDGWRAK